MSALWTWAVEEGYVEEHVLQRIERPSTGSRPKVPIPKDEVEALLKAARWTKEWRSDPGKRSERPTADRDIAMILLLLDTGIRASELTSMNKGDLDLDTNQVLVKGKGAGWPRLKATIGSFQPKDSQSHLEIRRDPRRGHGPGGFTIHGRKRHGLEAHDSPQSWVAPPRLGKKAGFDGIHPHRFRHTFAIEYLRNGGDIFTLQEPLGHSTLMMVRRYARVAQVDIERTHRKANPMQNWRL